MKLPRDDVDPLHVFVKPKADLEKLGSVTKIVMKSNEPVPQVIRDSIVPDFNGEKTRNIDIKVGIKYLGDLFSAVGAANLGAETFFSKAATLSFHYEDVRKDYIEPFDIDKYLRNATPDINSSFCGDMDKQGEGYIATEILKSRSFGVSAQDKNGYGIAVDIPAMEGLLMVKPDIKVSTDGKDVITFSGEKSLCFALKLFYLWIDTGSGSPRFSFGIPKGKFLKGIELERAAPLSLFRPTILKKNDLIGIQ